MKRVLTFDGEKAGKRFDLCRVAVLAAGDGKGESGREITRKQARILDALDAVSEPKDGADERVLKALPQTIALAQEDHALLAKYLDATPWLPRAARDAVDVQDWADSAEKVD